MRSSKIKEVTNKRLKYDYLAAIQLCQYEYKYLAYRADHKLISEKRALRAFCEMAHVPYKLSMFQIENSRKFQCFLFGLPEEFCL